MGRRRIGLQVQHCWVLIASIGILVHSGCSGGNLGAAVGGTVTLDGKTIGPGVIIYAPLGGKENPAVGTILPDGSYTVKTGGKRGLPVGTYKVCVQVFEQSPDRKPGERTMTPSKSLVPRKFTSVETSGMQYDIVAGSNTIDVAIASDTAE